MMAFVTPLWFVKEIFKAKWIISSASRVTQRRSGQLASHQRGPHSPRAKSCERFSFWTIFWFWHAVSTVITRRFFSVLRVSLVKDVSLVWHNGLNCGFNWG